jgi:hypothetical protein
MLTDGVGDAAGCSGFCRVVVVVVVVLDSIWNVSSVVMIIAAPNRAKKVPGAVFFMLTAISFQLKTDSVDVLQLSSRTEGRGR